jgi:hypothetical protein
MHKYTQISPAVNRRLDFTRIISEYLYIPPDWRNKKRQVTMIQTTEWERQARDAIPGAFAGDTGNELQGEKIYCANCIHCKLIPVTPEDKHGYMLRIRCAAGKWKKKLGTEKLYKYCTITRRYLDFCDAYEEMGDTREFIRELRKSLLNEETGKEPEVCQE